MLNPNTIFRKTELGVVEIAERKLGVRAELRRLLILIDGRNTLAKLAAFVRLPEIDPLIYELQSLGLIDTSAGAGVAAPPSLSAPPTITGMSASPNADTALVPTQEQFTAARMAAVRFVNDNLGPSGEAVAIKLERTRNALELREAVALARGAIERSMGAAAAQRFLEHVRMSVK